MNSAPIWYCCMLMVSMHDLTEQCRELGHFTREQQIPLAVIDQPLDNSAEVSLYDVGVLIICCKTEIRLSFSPVSIYCCN